MNLSRSAEKATREECAVHASVSKHGKPKILSFVTNVRKQRQDLDYFSSQCAYCSS